MYSNATFCTPMLISSNTQCMQHVGEAREPKLFVIQITSHFHYEVSLARSMVEEDCNHVSVYTQKVISFCDDIKSNSPWHRQQREAHEKEERTCCIAELNLIASESVSCRFLYWRVCCYVCTREPKKKKRQMMRRETYRQQQQLALQDRPA